MEREELSSLMNITKPSALSQNMQLRLTYTNVHQESVQELLTVSVTQLSHNETQLMGKVYKLSIVEMTYSSASETMMLVMDLIESDDSSKPAVSLSPATVYTSFENSTPTDGPNTVQ